MSRLQTDPNGAPLAARHHHVWQRPSGDVTDEYAWLADRDRAEVLEYLEAENAYTERWFAPHRPLVDRLFNEIKSRIQEADISDPVPVDDWYYVTTTEEGAPYPAYRRGPSESDCQTELVLDLNAEADGAEYFDLGGLEMSPDHRLAAWSVDHTGNERYTIHFRDVAAGVDAAETLTETAAAGIAWSNDGHYVFYVTADALERPCHVWRHRLGTDQSEDALVYEETDEAFYVGIAPSRNREMVFIQAGSKTSAETWCLDPNAPTAPPRCVRLRAPDIDYQVDHWGDRLVLLTNADALDFRVMAMATPGQPWEELVAHRPGRRIAGIEAFADFLALYEWDGGQEQIRIVWRDGSERRIDIDSSPHEIGFGANERYDTTVVRVTHQSLTSPVRVIDIDVNSGVQHVVKQQPTPNVDLGAYRSERRWATASDGTNVPVDIVWHRDTPLDGTAPCTVWGYGAYEVSIAPWFSVGRLSLLDRGHVWALAHPRGGGELGRRWYEDGKLLNKRNTFTDTLAVRDHLVATKVCASNRVALRGGSAGGLLVGACITAEPAAFAAAVASVPFVDIVTTMSDPSLPLTVTEWEEWGNPTVEPFASYMLSYSPYDNTTPGPFPAIYITAGLNDPRVGYYEPAKWTARLRRCSTSGNPILLKTELQAGHGGPTGRYDAWRDEAETMAFLLVNLGDATARGDRAHRDS